MILVRLARFAVRAHDVPLGGEADVAVFGGAVGGIGVVFGGDWGGVRVGGSFLEDEVSFEDGEDAATWFWNGERVSE